MWLRLGLGTALRRLVTTESTKFVTTLGIRKAGSSNSGKNISII